MGKNGIVARRVPFPQRAPLSRSDVGGMFRGRASLQCLQSLVVNASDEYEAARFWNSSVDKAQRKPTDRPTFIQWVKRALRFDLAHGRVPKPGSRSFGNDRPNGR